MPVSHTRLSPGAIASLIYESLGSVFTEDHAITVLKRAMADGRLRSIPSGGDALSELVEVHLAKHIAEASDSHTARAIVEHIVSILPAELFEGEQDRITGRSRDDLEVVIITPSETAFSRIARRFPPMAMLARQRERGPLTPNLVDPVVLVDARTMRPVLEPMNELQGRDVILWGADRWSEAEVARALSPARSITRCPGEIEAEELPMVCRALRMHAPNVSSG
jgi:hypothetical protein